MEEQSEAYRDGSLIACGEEEDSWGCGTMSAWGEALCVPGGRTVLKIESGVEPSSGAKEDSLVRS